MIKINLLPHRIESRKLRKNAFFTMLGFSAVMGLLVIIALGSFFAHRLSNQADRNQYIKQENTRLDTEIKEIVSLKQEIASLKARQQAVENLQSDRNQPVYLMGELVRQVPEGIYLRSFKQDGQRVALNGYAQSNERVSELLRNLSNNSPWLDHPDLIEIRAASLATGKDSKRVFDFNVNVDIIRPSGVKPPLPGEGKKADGLAVPGATPVSAK
ncbi:PilN domain-containing protein [Glaciimonas immobilis]|uniref:Type IV pilus assembly protein PilN n=1 Tax=Glaciimonas immobilis TaxID=728004 RepID=A0A840RZ35_9BURK|nr:PilN domain-containing protein [Glaciimonas immobilis]KAF3998733.1 PilN domain-containing protein [Glaciimonas immobilis]MBB5201619.1 type IV pilus assembly protein PilN [Glaciimonas immobilis]